MAVYKFEAGTSLMQDYVCSATTNRDINVAHDGTTNTEPIYILYMNDDCASTPYELWYLDYWSGSSWIQVGSYGPYGPYYGYVYITWGTGSFSAGWNNLCARVRFSGQQTAFGFNRGDCTVTGPCITPSVTFSI